MPLQIKIRRDSSGDFETANTVLADGEIALETDTGKMKVGNGSTAYNSLQFVTEDAARVLFVAMQGTVSGYVAGGLTPSTTDAIDKYSFVNSNNATDVGNLAVVTQVGGGFSSPTHGILSGGRSGDSSVQNQKWSFSSDGNAAQLSVSPFEYGGYWHSVSSPDTGFDVGGSRRLDDPTTPTINPNSGRSSRISKFLFASEVSSNAGVTLTSSRAFGSGAASATHGYSMGGSTGTGPVVSTNIIEKFSFTATSGTASDVGDLAQPAIDATAGNSSSEKGYVTGGNASGIVNTIQSFPFASDSNSSDGGDLIAANSNHSGSNSTTKGYAAGGVYSPAMEVIQSYPFANNSNATDLGNLATKRKYANYGNIQI